MQLVVGVLPAERPPQREWRVHADRRAAARKTWVAHALAEADTTVRFVYEVAPPHGPPGRRRMLSLASVQSELDSEAERHHDMLGLTLGRNSSACVLAELTHAWFAHALRAWPSARYYAKTEDDVYVQVGLLRFDLARLSAPLVWAGLFAWTGSGDESHYAGCWGGSFEDDPRFSPKIERGLLSKERGCPLGAKTLKPAPTHEIDVRSRGVASALAACSYPALWLGTQPRRHGGGRGRARSANVCTNDYAGVQGHWLSRCADEPITLAHLTWSKVHSNAADNGWRPFAAASKCKDRELERPGPSPRRPPLAPHTAAHACTSSHHPPPPSPCPSPPQHQPHRRTPTHHAHNTHARARAA